VGTIASVGSVVAIVVGGYVYIDDKKADEIMVAGNLQEQRIEMIDYQLDDKRRDITRINKKIQSGTATDDDLMYLEDLKSDKEWLQERKKSIQKK